MSNFWGAVQNPYPLIMRHRTETTDRLRSAAPVFHPIHFPSLHTYFAISAGVMLSTFFFMSGGIKSFPPLPVNSALCRFFQFSASQFVSVKMIAVGFGATYLVTVVCSLTFTIGFPSSLFFPVSAVTVRFSSTVNPCTSFSSDFLASVAKKYLHSS